MLLFLELITREVWIIVFCLIFLLIYFIFLQFLIHPLGYKIRTIRHETLADGGGGPRSEGYRTARNYLYSKRGPRPLSST